MSGQGSIDAAAEHSGPAAVAPDAQQRGRELAALLADQATTDAISPAVRKRLVWRLDLLIERREADAAASALDAVRVQLAAHSNPGDDPCEDYGAVWPCDVARALWPDVVK